MRVIILVIAIAVVFAGLGLWLGVHGNSAPGEGNTNCGISMMTDRLTYAVGEPIVMALKVFNNTEEEVTFHFNTSQRYDFVITDEEENEIWRWSGDRMFAMVLGEETLGPDNPGVTYTAQYKSELSPGYYKITGILVATDRPMTGSVIIIVK